MLIDSSWTGEGHFFGQFFRKIYDRPCPDGLVWDDNLKRCEWTSDTCNSEDDNNNNDDDDDNGNNDDDGNNDNGDAGENSDEHDPDNKCPCVSSCTGMPIGATRPISGVQ